MSILEAWHAFRFLKIWGGHVGLEPTGPMDQPLIFHCLTSRKKVRAQIKSLIRSIKLFDIDLFNQTQHTKCFESARQ